MAFGKIPFCFQGRLDKPSLTAIAMPLWNIMEVGTRNRYRLAVIAHQLEHTGKFYMVLWRSSSKVNYGNWKVYERTQDGQRGRFLADLELATDNAAITCKTDWKHLPPSDPVALELENRIKQGLKETEWMMEKREK